MTHRETDSVSTGPAEPTSRQNDPNPAAVGKLAYGYLRAGDGPSDALPLLREALITAADRFGLVLAHTFTDYGSNPPSARPALRQLMKVARALRPHAVLVPDAWHLSQSPTERTAVLDEFRHCGCQVIAVEDGAAHALNPCHL